MTPFSQKLIFGILLVLFSSSSWAAKAKSPSGFTPEQQDRLMADFLAANTNDSDVYKFASIVLAGRGASEFYDGNLSLPHGRYSPFDKYTATDVALQQNMSREKYISTALFVQQKVVEGLSMRGTVGEKILDSIGNKSAKYGPMAQIGAVIGKEVILEYVSLDPRSPSFNQDIAAESLAFAFNEIRSGSELGKILASYLNEYKLADPRQDRTNFEGVQRGIAERARVADSKDIKQLLEKNKNILDSLDLMKKKLEERNAQNLKAKNQGRTELDPVEVDFTAAQRFKTAGDGLKTTSYILTLMGHGAEAEMVDRLSQSAKALEAVYKNTDPQSLDYANAYLFAATMVYSIFKKNKSESPYPVIFEMLVKISKQIEELKYEMNIRFNQVDGTLGVLVAQSLTRMDANLHNSTVIAEQLSIINEKMNAIPDIMRNQMTTFVDISFAEQDRQCFLQAGGGEFLPLEINQFATCVSTYIDRGTIHARSAMIGAPGGSTSTNGVYESKFFPYGDDYEKIRLLVDSEGREYERSLAHPAVWNQSAILLSNLFKIQPENLSVLDKGKDQILISLRTDELVATGNDIRNFQQSLLVKMENGRNQLRAERIRLLTDELKELQSQTLQKIHSQLGAQPTPVDVTKDFNQPVNKDYPYQVMNQPIPYCSDVKPKITSVQRFQVSLPGGGGGYIQDQNPMAGPIVVANYRTAHNVTDAQSLADYVTTPMSAVFAELKADQIVLGRSLLDMIPADFLLIEASSFKNAKVVVCISKLEWANINQSPDWNLKSDLLLGLQIGLTFDMPEGKKSLVIQEIVSEMKIDMSAPKTFQFLTGNQTAYYFTPNDVFTSIWPTLSPQVQKSFKDVSSAEVKASFDGFKSLWQNEFIAKQIKNINSVLDADLNPLDLEHAQNLKLLDAMLEIGLNKNLSSVKQLKQTLKDTYRAFTPEVLAQRVLSGDITLDALAATLEAHEGVLEKSIQQLAADPKLSAAEDMLSMAQNELNSLYWLRAIPEKAGKTKTKNKKVRIKKKS